MKYHNRKNGTELTAAFPITQRKLFVAPIFELMENNCKFEKCVSVTLFFNTKLYLIYVSSFSQVVVKSCCSSNFTYMKHCASQGIQDNNNDNYKWKA